MYTTDTDGKKVTNYKGKEDGITDYDNKHGHANKNEGERYRDTKKKNKGRRVSVFLYTIAKNLTYLMQSAHSGFSLGLQTRLS